MSVRFDHFQKIVKSFQRDLTTFEKLSNLLLY